MKHEQFDVDAATDSFKRLLTKLRKNNVSISKFTHSISSLLTEDETFEMVNNLNLSRSENQETTDV